MTVLIIMLAAWAVVVALDEHHDNHTGAVWSDDRSATVPERTNR